MWTPQAADFVSSTVPQARPDHPISPESSSHTEVAAHGPVDRTPVGANAPTVVGSPSLGGFVSTASRVGRMGFRP